MAQIQVKSYLQMRGKAYKCLRCNHVAEKKRISSHIYKDHVPLTKAPFYCRLCLFRSTDQDSLEKHVSPRSYPAHSQKVAEYEATTGSPIDVSTFLMKSLSPYHLQEGIDFVALSDKDSEEIWRSRSKVQKSAQPSSFLDQPSDLSLSSDGTLMAQPISFSRSESADQLHLLRTLNQPKLQASCHDVNTINTYPVRQILNLATDSLRQQSSSLHLQSSTARPVSKPKPVVSNSSSSTRTPAFKSPPPINRISMPENVFDSIMDSFDPNEPISPGLSSNFIDALNTPPIPAATATVTATTSSNDAGTSALPSQTTASKSRPLQTQDSATSPIPSSSTSSQISSPEVKMVVEAINTMTSSICDAINKQTNQFSMLRATLTTFLRRTEDQLYMPPSPAPKRQVASEVYVPTKKRKTQH